MAERPMSMKSGQPIPFPLRRKPAPEIAPRRRGRPASLSEAPGLPSPAQRDWLARGLAQPGGKLPLFWDDGRRVDQRTIKSCMEQGWAEPWFANPMKPDWLVCKLTAAGRSVALDDIADAPGLDDDDA
jgi:hypothetical protein